MLESSVALFFLGLLIGSFLNVVIHRLPIMMQREWESDCKDLLEIQHDQQRKFNLSIPRSACPTCDHQIRWYENIPVISYLLLRGKCSGCKTKISLRYPAIELLTAAWFAWFSHLYGLSYQAAAWAALASLLISLTFIDWDTQLLPDDLTYPTLWLGLFSTTLGFTHISLDSAVIGALVGYLSLWSITQLFKLLTGKVGMGNGDFKLLAALGAWLGVQALLPIILIASFAGAVIGITMKLISKDDFSKPIPFGPFLSIGGFICIAFGTPAVLNLIGLAF